MFKDVKPEQGVVTKGNPVPFPNVTDMTICSLFCSLPLQHCENQIGEVQAKLLETQQQLAVAISTDRKKDVMIEQLDKVRMQHDG